MSHAESRIPWPNFLRNNARRLVKYGLYPVMGKYRRKGAIQSETLAIRRDRYLEVAEANERIREMIVSDQPFMAARFGSVELGATIEIDRRKSLGAIEKYYEDFALRGAPWARAENFTGLKNNAGFFPINEDLLFRFASLMVESMSQVDLLGSWAQGESMYWKELGGAQICELACLEPYYFPKPWSSSLAGRRVLVIHPFSETIQRQYEEKRKDLFGEVDVLPQFDLSVIKAVQSIAGNDSGFATWFEALDHMLSEVSKCDFDTAIIGCGAYGFPLAAEIKKMGKQAIHLGGATQILFGIKGSRWEVNPAINRFFNDSWCRPSVEETPKNVETVENGCYW